jgi:hypothetical protein
MHNEATLNLYNSSNIFRIVKSINIFDELHNFRVASLCISVVYWSEFLATDPEARVRSPALPEKKVVSLERGPLSLVSTTEELLDRKVAAPV